MALPEHEKPTHLDLFSGIGGFALAAKWAGFRTIGFSEIEPFCCQLLAERFPSVRQFGDIRNITQETIETPFIITGGFPCQPFSIAGKRRGRSDERFLWDELFRVISELRPAYALIENVLGLFVVDGGFTPNRIFSDLVSERYDCLWNLIPASAVGAPHQRDRLWLLAYSDEIRCRMRKDFHRRSSVQSISKFNGNLAQTLEERGEQQYRINSQCGTLNPNSESKRQPETGRLQRTRSKKRLSSVDKENVPADRRQERIQRQFEETLSQIKGFSWCKNVRGIEDLRNRSDIPEPLVRGTCDGIPDWVDRIAALGNAIIPQVAFQILKAIRQEVTTPVYG